MMSIKTTLSLLSAFLTAITLLTMTKATLADTPATMRAGVIADGSVQIRSVPVPEPGPGQVRVKVRAIGVNPVDWKRAEAGNDGQIAGRDFAGVIDAAGPSAGEWKAGDEVIGLAASGTGSYAEYVLASTTAIAKKPNNTTFEEAAGLPVVAETAWRALVTVGNVQKGQRVLIHGGAGGVGSMAVQIAKARGAYVITTASARNHEYLHSLGADETIDYSATRFENVVQNVDMVFNTTNPEVTQRSIGVIKSGGVLVSIVGEPPADACKAAGIRGAVTGPSTGEMLPQVVELVNTGKMRVHISQRLPLAEAAKAWELSHSGHTRGKIVLTVIPATKLVYPMIPNVGGAMPLLQTAEQPHPGAKVVFEITAEAKPDEVNKGVVRMARMLNVYGAAGLKATDVKVVAAFHGEAINTILTDAAYQAKFGVEKNPNLPVLNDLRRAGVETFVCGQALAIKEIDETDVAEGVTVATAALTVLISRQNDGYVYILVP